MEEIKAMIASGNLVVAAPCPLRLRAGEEEAYFLLETAAFSLEPAVSLTLLPAAIWMVSPV